MLQSRLLAGAIGLVLAAAAVVPTLDAALVAQSGTTGAARPVPAAAVTPRSDWIDLLDGLAVQPESHAAGYRRDRFGAHAHGARVVSLRQAWVSGAWRWSAAERASFAAAHPGPAVIALASPCALAEVRVAVKARWHLAVDPAERAALAAALTRCAVATPVPPGAAG